MEGEIKNLIHVWLSIMASLCYCHFISSQIPIGKYRLFSLLPVFYLFAALPLRLSSAFATAVTTFFITWLANFKLLLFSFGLGPLSLGPPKSLVVFITVASLPIKIKQQRSAITAKPKTVPLNLPAEVLFLAILVSVLYDYKERIDTNVVLVLYCCVVFLLLDVLIAFSGAMGRAVVGLEVDPPSDEPYLSTSLRDFWGRRWNLVVTDILRRTVYMPVRSAAAALLGDEWAPLPAVLAAFLVSGVMHEVLFYNITRATPSWETTSFFVLQGVGVVVEFGLKRALTDRWRLPWFVSVALTVGFVVVTSFWLFFPPLVRNGADERVVQELRVFVEFIKTRLNLK